MLAIGCSVPLLNGGVNLSSEGSSSASMAADAPSPAAPLALLSKAAHVTPYMGAETNTPQNGILLRCDIHTLWDLGLIGIEEATGRIVINRALEGTEYERFAGAKAMLPASPTSRPSAPALKTHRENSGLAPPQ